jgi:hypothetical protein
MAKLSMARKAGILARVIDRRVGGTRRYGALMHAGRTTGGHFKKVLGLLWLEVTGFVFLCLAVIGGLAMIREYLRYTAGKTTSGRVALAVGFTAIFGWFGLSSFWRVRKKSPK